MKQVRIDFKNGILTLEVKRILEAGLFCCVYTGDVKRTKGPKT